MKKTDKPISKAKYFVCSCSKADSVLLVDRAPEQGGLFGERVMAILMVVRS